MKRAILILVLVFISGLLCGADISFYNTTKTLGNDTFLDFYRLEIEGKAYGSLEIESMYEWLAEDDTVYTSYRLKIPYKWKNLKISITRIEIEKQEIFLSQLDLRYLLEKSWLVSADIGIGSQWMTVKEGKLQKKWKFILGKRLEKEIALWGINLKVKSETDFSTSNFQKFQNESKLKIGFLLGKANIFGIKIPGVYFSFLYEVKYYKQRSTNRMTGFEFSF